MRYLFCLALLFGCGGSIIEPTATPDAGPPPLCVLTEVDRTKGIGLSECADARMARCFGEFPLVDCVVWPGQPIEHLCVAECVSTDE